LISSQFRGAIREFLILDGGYEIEYTEPLPRSDLGGVTVKDEWGRDSLPAADDRTILRLNPILPAGVEELSRPKNQPA